jgi:acetylornithine deacetylase/succinyl-diaminopimelate desuccinylase-like protein
VALDRDVVLLAVPDEETGGELGAGWMMERHYAELDPEYVLDEGGFGSRDLFADGKLVYGISVAERKILWLRVTAEGVAGHGSQPHDENPNDRLVKALSRLLAEPRPGAPVAVLDTLRKRAGPLARNKYMNAIQNSTVSLTTLRSGVGDPPKVNVIPSVAQATLDCRLLPGVTREAWLDELRRRLADPELKIEVTYESEDPTVSTQDTPLYRALEAAILRHDPGAVVAPILVPYGTDSNKFRPRGVKSYGITPAVYPAEIAASMHGDAERFPAAEMGKAIRVLYEALSETAGAR